MWTMFFERPVARLVSTSEIGVYVRPIEKERTSRSNSVQCAVVGTIVTTWCVPRDDESSAVLFNPRLCD